MPIETVQIDPGASQNGTGISPVVSEPAFRRQGLGYVYEPSGTGFRFLVDYLTHAGDDVRATLIADRMNGTRWLRVHRGKVLMEGSNSKRDCAKQLQEMYDDDDSGRFWRKLVEDVCGRVLDAEEEGEPFVMVGRGARCSRPPAIIDPIVQAEVPTILFGPPGTGKGYLVIYMAVLGTLGMSLGGLKARKSNWLYLDWEDTADVMTERIQQVCMGLSVPPVEIHRRWMKGKSFHSQVHQIARYVTENSIDVVVVDSVEKAIGAAGEGMGYEDKAKRLFDASDCLRPCAVLFIDHESWQQKNGDSKSVGKAFGSYMKMAWVRAGWQARKEQEFGAKISQVALYHAKSNHGPQLSPLMFQLDFSEPDAVRVSRGDIAQSEELSKVLPMANRIDNALKGGPMSAGMLAVEIGESEASIRTVLNRHKDKRFRKLDDGRWGKAVMESRPNLRLVETDDGEIPF